MAGRDVKEGAKTTFNSNQVFNGTWGEVWLDGEFLAEATACKAEINYKKTAVSQIQKMADGQKIIGLEPKGEIKLHHINDRVMKKEQEMVKEGKTPTHTIIAGIHDPDAAGGEKATFFNCVWDKAILTDWEAGKMGERSYAFTFDDWDVNENSTK